jgi:hypothetical protein
MHAGLLAIIQRRTRPPLALAILCVAAETLLTDLLQPTQQKLATMMIGYWSAFARTGDPNTAGVPSLGALPSGAGVPVLRAYPDRPGQRPRRTPLRTLEQLT